MIDYKKYNRLLFMVLFIILLVLVDTLLLVYIIYTQAMSRDIEYSSPEIKQDEIVDVINPEDTYKICMTTSPSNDELPDNIKSIINEINNYYQLDPNYKSYKYYDINTGFSVSVNEHLPVESASTVKAPTILYVWKQVSEGKIDLNERLVYTSEYLDDWGPLHDKEFGTDYSTRELIKNTIVYSDNSSYRMLFYRYGKGVVSDYWKSKDTEVIFRTGHNPWGNNNPHDAIVYMKELYDFYMNDTKYGEEAMSDFLNAKKKFIKAPKGIKIANKAGWVRELQHDAAIVFTEQPYIVAAFSTLGSTYKGPYYTDISDLTYKLHTEYWNYKNNTCGEYLKSEER